MRSDPEIQTAMEQYADMMRRICFLHLKNPHDSEDIFQTVFLKFALFEGNFETVEHQKAWFLRVTINACKDLLRSAFRRHSVSLTALGEDIPITEKRTEVLSVLLTLPDKYKQVLYLYYYEDYSAAQISTVLHQKENTIYTRLARGRTLMKEALGGEWD